MLEEGQNVLLRESRVENLSLNGEIQSISTIFRNNHVAGLASISVDTRHQCFSYGAYYSPSLHLLMDF